MYSIHNRSCLCGDMDCCAKMRVVYCSMFIVCVQQVAKAQSLPVASAQAYQELMSKERAQWEMEQEYLRSRSRSRSQTPEPAERPRSLSASTAARGRYSHSPERMSTPVDRGGHHNLNPIPENPRLLANGFREAAMNGGHYESLASAQAQAHAYHRGVSQAGNPIYETVYHSGGYGHPQAYVSHSTRTAQPQGPQRTTMPVLVSHADMSKTCFLE
jgi:hypothetical protein